ncbi:MAG: DUF2752 domain-containing protein, partial [Actinobacteria bacterium]|nr:DUF2752 domain-containing protein [Actinomycetota bacterium]
MPGFKTPTVVPPTPLSRLGIAAVVGRDDAMKAMTGLAFGGLTVAALLAVFGMPPGQILMPTWSIGVVTPTCGLTRASTAFARGDFVTAWAFNPAAFAVFAWAAAMVARWFVGTIRGTWLNVQVHPTRLGWWILIILFAALW